MIFSSSFWGDSSSCCGGCSCKTSQSSENKNTMEKQNSGGHCGSQKEGASCQGGGTCGSHHHHHGHHGSLEACENEGITLNFILPNGETKTVKGPIGATVLEVAHHHDIDIEGACGGSLSCSTCHVVVEDQWFHRLPETTEDEEDMLDLAFDVTPTSRLCCQLILTPELDGLTMKVPEQTRHLVTAGRK